jgi:hypothetical protein
MRLLTHLLQTALGDLFRVFGAFVLFTAVAGGVVFGYAYEFRHQWPPSVLYDIGGGALALLIGYAASTTVLLRTLTNTILGATKAVEKEAEKVLQK